jgi:hypothetical protein
MKFAFTFTSHSRPASRSQPASALHCFKHSIPESSRPASQPACEPTSQSNIFAGRVTTSAYQNAFEI